MLLNGVIWELLREEERGDFAYLPKQLECCFFPKSIASMMFLGKANG